MSNHDSTSIRASYQVDAPPNFLSEGYVECEAYHRATRAVDYNAKLFILADGRFHLHTTEGVFPVRGYYFTKTAVVIESEPIHSERYFSFLDALREGALTNMVGAAPYLSNAFGLSKSEARSVLKEWMETFGQRHPQADEC